MDALYPASGNRRDFSNTGIEIEGNVFHIATISSGRPGVLGRSLARFDPYKGGRLDLRRAVDGAQDGIHQRSNQLDIDNFVDRAAPDVSDESQTDVGYDAACGAIPEGTAFTIRLIPGKETLLDGLARLDGYRVAGLELDVLALNLDVAIG